MSQDLFHQNSPARGPDPLAQPVYQQPPKRSNPVLLWGCGIASVLVMLVCCGGGAVMMYGFGEIMSAEIEMELRDNPVIEQHIGTIESLSMDFAKSSAVEGDDVYVYNVQGDRGSGELTVESVTNFEGYEEVVSASLRLPSGEVIEVPIER